MSPTETSNNAGSFFNSDRQRSMRCSSNWSSMNIFAMVLGFIVFWPLGLFMIYWIMSGRNAVELPAVARRLWSKIGGKWDLRDDTENNVVFNEYQQTQYDRIHEIKQEIKGRSTRFQEFRADVKRKADQEEFDHFMASNPPRNDA